MAAAAAPACEVPADPTLTLVGRQELAIRRFTQYCSNPKSWGVLLFHKVGTGKTFVSLLIALHSISDLSAPGNATKIVVIAPPGLFANFSKDLCKLANHRQYLDKLISYPVNELIDDVNRKSMRIDFSDKIVIIDEGHRLLSKNIADSLEAGAITSFHPMIQDIYFKNKIGKASRCIIMTGTPIQKDLSDVCKLLNFVSRTDKFTRETYAPIAISQATWRWAREYLAAAYAQPGVIYNWVVKPIASLAAAAFTASAASAAAAASAPAADPENTVFTPANIQLATNILIAAGATLYTAYSASKMVARVEKEESKTLRLQRGGFSFYDNHTSFSFVADFLSIPTAPGPAVQLCLQPWIAHNQEKIEELTENVWKAEYLAEHASEFTSVYDPDIDKELNAGFDLDAMDDYDATPSSIRGKISDANGAFSFPSQVDHAYSVEYDEYQINILNKLYSGDLPLAIKKILYLEEYGPPIANNKGNFGGIRRYARMIGNFSQHIEKYYVIKNETSTKYIPYDRATGDPILPADITNRINGKKLFECPKFTNLLKKMLEIRKTGTIPVAKQQRADGSTEYEPHAHFLNGQQYLPLVYSYTEDYGLAPFAAFLEAHGFSYVLLHPGQATNDPAMLAGARTTYAPMPADCSVDAENNVVGIDPANNVLCVLLHPTMTEGFNFTRNPALFSLEPCNTFGDSEQVYGRIFRRYNNEDIYNIEHSIDPATKPFPLPAGANPPSYPAAAPPFYPPQPKKLIGIYVCMTRNDSIKIWTDFRKTVNKIYRSEHIFTLPAMKESLFSMRVESPDFFGFRRLQRERGYLKSFEESVHGGTAGDIVESHACYLENRFTSGIPVINNLLDGHGMPDPRPAYVRTTRAYSLTRNPDGTEPSRFILPRGKILKVIGPPSVQGANTVVQVKVVQPIPGEDTVETGYIDVGAFEEVSTHPVDASIRDSTRQLETSLEKFTGSGADTTRPAPSTSPAGRASNAVHEASSVVLGGVGGIARTVADEVTLGSFETGGAGSSAAARESLIPQQRGGQRLTRRKKNQNYRKTHYRKR